MQVKAGKETLKNTFSESIIKNLKVGDSNLLTFFLILKNFVSLQAKTETTYIIWIRKQRLYLALLRLSWPSL